MFNMLILKGYLHSMVMYAKSSGKIDKYGPAEKLHQLMCCRLTASCRSQHLGGVRDGRIRDGCPGQHAGHLAGSRLFFEHDHPGGCPSFSHLFLDPKMMVGKYRHLWQMGNAEHLLERGHVLQFS